MSGLGIVMPTRNVASMVNKVLDGIDVNQWKKIQRIVVVDNASSDGSVEIIQNNGNFKSNSDKFAFILNAQDQGYGYSLNSGITFLAQDPLVKFIAVIHSDDQFEGKEIIDHYLRFCLEQHSEVLLISRTRDKNAIFSLRQGLRNFGNSTLSRLARLATRSQLEDFNTPFFITRSEMISSIQQTFELKNDIFFHPRLNLLFTTQFNPKYVSCKWKRASETSHIPITRMGVHLLLMFCKFGFLYRVCGLSFQKVFSSISRDFK